MILMPFIPMSLFVHDYYLISIAHLLVQVWNHFHIFGTPKQHSRACHDDFHWMELY
jgi:hypothetical protein